MFLKTKIELDTFNLKAVISFVTVPYFLFFSCTEKVVIENTSAKACEYKQMIENRSIWNSTLNILNLTKT